MLGDELASKLNEPKTDLMVGVVEIGTNMKDDIMRIYEKIHLVVTNPGRILDSMGKKVTNVENCKSLCLNEADKLLSYEKVHIVYSSYLLNFVS